MPTAGWIVKEQYGDANTIQKFDIGMSFTDPALVSVLQAAVLGVREDHAVCSVAAGSTHSRTYAFVQSRLYAVTVEIKLEPSMPNNVQL